MVAVAAVVVVVVGGWRLAVAVISNSVILVCWAPTHLAFSSKLNG